MTVRPAAVPAGRPAFAVLCGLFFLSGFAALIYQTAWHRMLGLFGGADSISAAIVVGAFLAGLGIGSLAAGLVVDRLSRRGALLWFAACELGIAAFAALSPFLFYDLVFGHLLPLADSRLAVFAVVFAGLLWPTFLMGCSLPLLSKAVVRDIAGSARQIGWLYGLNTAGAGAGAFVAGWMIIGHAGYDGAVYIAALLNLVVAAGGLLLARARDIFRAPAEAAAGPASSHVAADRILVVRWCALVFISGFLIVALQIVWYRLIGVMLQSNAYAFSLVLGVFLLGDALGLMHGARTIARIEDPRGFFLRMQAVAALLAIAAALLVWLLVTRGVLPDDVVDRDIVSARPSDIALVAFLTLLIVLPASFVMGFSFPVVQKAVQQDMAVLGRRVGLVQLANILGNSTGSLVAGLLLLHWFGTAGTLRLLAALGLAFAVVALLRAPSRRSALRAGAVSSALAAAIVVLPGGAVFWSGLHGARAAEQVVVREDRTGLAVVRLNRAGRGRMYIQGHSQSCLPFCTVHAFLGAIGPLTHPDPRRVLVIGSGSGGTPYSAGIDPRTEQVRAIEIVAPVIEALRQFVAEGGRLGIDRFLSDPRYRIEIADGRHALAIDAQQYDVIEADAILPKSSLSGLLYSQEFFRQVREQLAPGGIFVQWAPTERSLQTFRSVFPHVVMVHPALIGSDRPIDYDAARILARLREPALRSHFEAASVDVDELLQWFRDKQPEIINNGQTGRIDDPNTDLFPRDEYYLNRRDPVGH